MIKRFQDLGITDCVTCEGQTCSGYAVNNESNEEYNLTISYDFENEKFSIVGCSSSNVGCPNDIDEYFESEEEAVNYLQITYSNFRCF